MKMKELIKKYKLQSFSKNFNGEVDWKTISIFYELPENFIREFKNEIDWFFVFSSQKLSEDFIREFENKVNWLGWTVISRYQKLSENLIREFKDKVSWSVIYEYQNLSLEFIKEFQKNITSAINDSLNTKISDTDVIIKSMNFIIKEMEKIKIHEDVKVLIDDTFLFYKSIIKRGKVPSEHFLNYLVELIVIFLNISFEWEEFKIQEFKNRMQELTEVKEL